MPDTKHDSRLSNVNEEHAVPNRAPEYQLMVFWRRPADGLDALLKQIEEQFVIKQIANLHWSKDRIVENFQRFYAMVEGHAYHKYTQAGMTPFLMVIVEDPSPTYEYRVAGGSGFKMVNAKSFDLKQKLRRQKGTSLHATTNHREFRRDLMYLTGQRAADYQPLSGAWDGTVEDLHQDIVGADGWRNLTEVFAVLNEAVDYVVLRNFEKLPNEHILGPHEDIDFLVEDVDAYHRAAAILNKEQAAHTKIGDRKIYFDFRAVEDFYYDPEWCRRLLRDKVLIRGFYALSQNDYFFSLLYHGHVHKPKISKDYGKRLLPIARSIGLDTITPEQIADPKYAAKMLSEFLKGNGYYLTRPNGCPAFNESFAASLSDVPFLYQSESNIYKEFMTLSGNAEHAVNFKSHIEALTEATKSRKWLLRNLAKRLGEYPADLLRRNLTKKQKDFLRPYVRRYTRYYEKPRH